MPYLVAVLLLLTAAGTARGWQVGISPRQVGLTRTAALTRATAASVPAMQRRGGDAKMQQQSSDGDDDDLWDSPPKNDGDAKLIATFITVALGGYSLILAYDGYLNGFYLFGKCLYAGANSGGWS